MAETFAGEIRNGVVVFDEGTPPLPEGLRVEVKSAALEKDLDDLRDLLLEFAGKAVGLPEDMAAQHDHYLRGTPKR